MERVCCPEAIHRFNLALAAGRFGEAESWLERAARAIETDDDMLSVVVAREWLSRKLAEAN